MAAWFKPKRGGCGHKQVSGSWVLQIVGLISQIEGFGLAFIKAIEAPIFQQLDGQIKIVRRQLVQAFDGRCRLGFLSQNQL